MFERITRLSYRLSAVALLALVAVPATLVAQEKVDEAAIEKIKAEGLQRSQVMETASWLTDVFGARLTGSPNIKAAGEWAAKKLTEWGMVNAKLEPWGYFGRGWTNERLSLHVIEPTPWPVIAYSAAWTPGTNGAVTGEVVRVQADSAKDLEKYRGKLRNAFVMLAAARQLNPKFTADAERYTQAELDSMGALGPQPARGGGAGGGRAGGGGGGRGGFGGAATANPETPRVVLRFPTDTTQMLLSGVLVGGGSLAGRAQLVDSPVGNGHVVSFGIRPYWRWQTHGTYILGFNAILNWNDLGAGRGPARTAPVVPEGR